MKRRIFLRQLSVAALGASGWLSATGLARAAAIRADPFYEHTFPDTSDQQVPLHSYLGKPLVLNFWATWCPPCVKEMPDLDALHKKHTQVHFVGLAVDTAVNVEKFGQKVSVSYPLLIAGHGGIKLMRELGNSKGGLPFTVVFDENGRVAQRMLGQIKPEELDQLLEKMA